MDTYGEPLFDWRPLAFFAWMAFVIVGAWVVASIKAQSFPDWLRWFGGLIGAGMGVGVLYVMAVTVNRWADTHVWGVLGLAG